MSKKTLKAIALTAAASFCVVSAQAALDSTYNNGDLIMGFQATSGTEAVLELNLGAATLYRDYTTTQLNIANVNSQLSALYGGATWYQNTNLYFGAAAANNNNNPPFGNGGDAGTPGDFASTIYYTKARISAGTVGAASSSPASLSGGVVSSIAANILSIGGGFDTADSGGLATFDPTPSGVAPVTWDEYNIVGQQGLTSTNSDGITGGIQDQLGTGWDFNSSFAGINNVVAVLDLYRISRFSSPTSGATTNTYEGSFVLTSDGNISFVAVPEPTSMGLLGLSALTLAALRRRRRQG